MCVCVVVCFGCTRFSFANREATRKTVVLGVRPILTHTIGKRAKGRFSQQKACVCVCVFLGVGTVSAMGWKGDQDANLRSMQMDGLRKERWKGNGPNDV